MGMKKVFIIGNGSTRSGFDLTRLHGPTYGCNTIYKDFIPDFLITCDSHTAEEAFNNGQVIYTRAIWKTKFINVHGAEHYHTLFNSNDPKIKFVPNLPYIGDKPADAPFQWGSGLYAALMACLTPAQTLYFLGFDFFDGNMYSDTNPNPDIWIYQFGKLVGMFNDKEFVFVVPKDFNQSLRAHNVRYIDYAQFELQGYK